MSFQNLSYFLFLPLMAVGYLRVVPKRAQTAFLLAGNLFFYWLNRPSSESFSLAWQLLPLVLLCLCCVFVWRMGLAIHAAHSRKQKSRLLAVAIGLLLAVLAVFKYYNLASAWLPFAPQLVQKLPFPLGISFYTFAALSYLLDVYRQDMPPERSLLHLSAGLTLFASITAGPICRARQLLPQLHQPHSFDTQRTVHALQLFCLGLFKKVAVADLLFMYVTPIYQNSAQHGGLSLLVATVAYTLYLYFDFVGYSQMARASALLLGLGIPENFKTPFFSTNFSGFWSRWHISLSSWLQDYLFTPLVWADASKLPLIGRKITRFSPIFCVFVVFFVSGFWHGNTLPFVIWGLLQAFYRVGEELLHQRLGKPKKKVPAPQQWAKRAGVFALWSFSMVFFAVGSGVTSTTRLSECFTILGGLFQGLSPVRFMQESIQAVYTGFYANALMAGGWLALLTFSLGLAFWLDWQRNFHFKNKSEELVLRSQKPLVRWLLYYALVLACFAGLVAQSGGFGGGSFAYGGF